MRLAYVLPFRQGEHVGVEKFAREKMSVWREMGIDAELIPIPPGDTRVQSLLCRYIMWPALVHRHQPDLIYLRHGATNPLVALVCARYPTVLEVHADVFEEFRRTNIIPYWRGLNMRTQRAADVKLANAAIFVNEHAATEPAFSSIRRRVVVPNGSILGAAATAPRNKRTVVGFPVGSLSPWHGIDRLPWLAGLAPATEFRVICPSPLAVGVRAIIGEPHSQITVVGTGSEQEYKEQLAGIDVGLGTLALDRKRMSDVSPLKVRDMAAIGIPLVLPYIDTALKNAIDSAIFQTAGYHDLLARRDQLTGFLNSCKGRRLTEATRQLVDLRALEGRRIEVFRELVSA